MFQINKSNKSTKDFEKLAPALFTMKIRHIEENGMHSNGICRTRRLKAYKMILFVCLVGWIFLFSFEN